MNYGSLFQCIGWPMVPNSQAVMLTLKIGVMPAFLTPSKSVLSGSMPEGLDREIR